MATTYVQDGRTIAITAGSALSAGDAVELTGTHSGMLVVAANDIANGAVGTAIAEGVVTLPKVSAAVYAQGDRVYWDTSTNKVDDTALTTAAGDFICGTAWVAGANAETTGTIKLNGFATVLET